MKVLVACEESQAVCTAFRERGHEAYSCDIQEPSGGHPEWHILGDALEAVRGGCVTTMDGQVHEVGKWDLLIAHPPCTYLTNAGTRHFSRRINPEWKVVERETKREKAFEFFMMFATTNCEKIAVENPVGYPNSHYRKADQIIHPYYFASGVDDKENYYTKRTCLWLKGLTPLKRTNDLKPPEPMYICNGEKCRGKKIGWCEGISGTTGGQQGRAKARSKTFPGIANAMADQWGGDVCSHG